MVYSVPILIPFPPFVEKPYTTPFIDAQRIPLGSNMYIKAYFLNQCHTTKLTKIQKKRMKIMTVNSKIKHECKTVRKEWCIGYTTKYIFSVSCDYDKI